MSSIKQKGRILILRGSSQYVSPDNYNVQEIGLAKALKAQGWSVLIISSGPHQVEKEIEDGITWLELRRFGKRMGWPIGSIKKIKEYKPDIIQLQDITNMATIQAFLASIINNIPLCLSLGEFQSKNLISRFMTKVFAFIINKQVSAVFSKTKEAMNFAKKLKLGPVVYCPIGIDTKVYSDENIGTFWWEEEIKTLRKNGNKILCHIGRLDKEDNLDFLLKVMEKLPKNYKLILTGNPSEYAKNKVEKYGLSERVVITGSISNSLIGKLLKLSDLYLSCSTYEIFGMAAAESIYHGCPVIGHPTGGISETVANKKNGVLIPERESKIWSQKIVELLQDDREYKKVKSYCEANKDSLTWKTRISPYQMEYEKLLNKSKSYLGVK